MTRPTSKRQSLKRALELIRTEKSKSLLRAANCLSGKPEGGWAETSQAMGDLLDALPARDGRTYSTRAFIAAVYEVDPITLRYRRREGVRADEVDAGDNAKENA